MLLGTHNLAGTHNLSLYCWNKDIRYALGIHGGPEAKPPCRKRMDMCYNQLENDFAGSHTLLYLPLVD